MNQMKLRSLQRNPKRGKQNGAIDLDVSTKLYFYSNRMSVEDFFKGGFKASDSEDEENDDEDEEEDQNLIDDEAEEGTDEEGEEEEGAGVEPMDEDEEEEDDEEDENDSLDGFIVDDDEEIEEEASSDEDASQSSEAKQEKKGDEPAFLSDNEETPFLSDNEQDETDEEMKKDEEEDEEESTDQALKKETVLEWIKQVETKRSVRDMRKLIVGFKSAVTMTDEESKPDGLVYTITDSEGKSSCFNADGYDAFTYSDTSVQPGDRGNNAKCAYNFLKNITYEKVASNVLPMVHAKVNGQAISHLLAATAKKLDGF